MAEKHGQAHREATEGRPLGNSLPCQRLCGAHCMNSAAGRGSPPAVTAPKLPGGAPVKLAAVLPSPTSSARQRSQQHASGAGGTFRKVALQFMQLMRDCVDKAAARHCAADAPPMPVPRPRSQAPSAWLRRHAGLLEGMADAGEGLVGAVDGRGDTGRVGIDHLPVRALTRRLTQLRPAAADCHRCLQPCFQLARMLLC